MPGTGWTLKSYGFMMMAGFLSAVYLAMRRCMRVKADPDAMLNCAFVSLVVGVIGARIFFVIHYWDESFANAANPLLAMVNLTQGGLEFLGGVIPAIFVVALYLKWNGLSIRLYGDAMAIVIPWGLCFGRIGCFLNGCCFGSPWVDQHQGPGSALAVQFPFGSPAAVRQWEERRITIPAELIYHGFKSDGKSPLWEAMPMGRDLISMTPEAREKPLRKFNQLKESLKHAQAEDPDGEETSKLAERLKRQESIRDAHRLKIAPLLIAQKYPSREDPGIRTAFSEVRGLADRHPALWARPSQLYSAVSALLLANLLARIFHRRKRHGLVFGLLLVLYPLNRLALEVIRSDNPLDTFGLTVSQAMSLGMIAAGIIWIVVIYRFMPERSPAAVPWTPPEQQGDTAPESG